MTTTVHSLVIALAAVSSACADNLQIKATNLKPVALARVLGDERLTPSFPFDGHALTLRLDASGSSDPDGSIQVYRWASATPQGMADDDAGADALAAHRRWVPAGASPDWPEDVVQPELTLPAAGMYAFTLWVIDDSGLVSDPSQLVVHLEAQP